jgi:histone chaperone ASF1
VLSCRIPYENLLGLTGLLLTCDYNGKEFVRVGYYVNIEYTDPELCELVAANTPPNPHRIDKLQRNIAAGERWACTACSSAANTLHCCWWRG